MTENRKNALVLLGGIVGSIALTTITALYLTRYWPYAAKHGQNAMVLFPSSTGGGFCYGIALMQAWVHPPQKNKRPDTVLAWMGLGLSGVWVLLAPSFAVSLCLPALLVGLGVLVYFYRYKLPTPQ